MNTITKIFCTLAIMMALVFANMQGIRAQMHVTVTFDPCYDECTTQERCVYQAYYSIDDTCGGITNWCYGHVDQACDEYTGSIDIYCPDCSDITHNPCYRVTIYLRKTCIGPGGSHVICEGSAVEYHTCYELVEEDVTIDISW